MTKTIVLHRGALVQLENDDKLYTATRDPILNGIFNIAGHDYFFDGLSPDPHAPRIVEVRSSSQMDGKGLYGAQIRKPQD